MTDVRVFSNPTPRGEWVHEGDECISQMGMRGKVLRVRELRSHTQATVQWENGYVGRVTITNLRKAPKEG